MVRGVLQESLGYKAFFALVLFASIPPIVLAFFAPFNQKDPSPEEVWCRRCRWPLMALSPSLLHLRAKLTQAAALGHRPSSLRYSRVGCPPSVKEIFWFEGSVQQILGFLGESGSRNPNRKREWTGAWYE